jgi:tRNA threonylcarbamoyl adenosine modification protein (Sua5/YciO/YrdC/YwlC family)
MARLFELHPDNPQPRLIKQIVELIRQGDVIVYPTDSAYALGCELGNKNALETIRRIRQFDKHHNFTLVCRDLSELSRYARVSNSAFRLLKAFTPGPYTFILRASSDVPRLMMHPKRKTIGLRVPDHPVVSALLEACDAPIISTTLILPGEDDGAVDLDEINRKIGHELGAIIEAGYCSQEPTTVVDLTETEPQVLREGKGDSSSFL